MLAAHVTSPRYPVQSGLGLLLIECKYYPSVLIENQFNQGHVRSAHLCQLYAYQQHLKRYRPDKPVTAILLYPVARQSLLLRYRLEGESVRILTLNLDLSWECVEADLLRLMAGS